jgi:tetratricopeptide (TPR) repeat protein
MSFLFRHVLLSGFLAISSFNLRATAQSVTEQFAPGLSVSVASLMVPEKAREHLAKARVAATHQKLDEFRKEITLALAVYPRYSEAYVLQSTLEITLHHYDKALEEANTALALDPNVPWATIIRASACNGLHRYAEARILLENYNPIQGPHWAVLFEQTRAAVGLRDPEAALTLSAETLTFVPESWLDNAHLLRANALQINHRFKEAIHEYEAYLASPRPQPLRVVVLDMLQRTQQTLSQPEVATLTSR